VRFSTSKHVTEINEVWFSEKLNGVASDAGPRLGTKPESVDAQKGTMLDIFARCLKKEIAQVCTLLK
jgi:hypothetical protein